MCFTCIMYPKFTIKSKYFTPIFYSEKLIVRLTKNSVVLKWKSILPEINFLPLFFSEKIASSGFSILRYKIIFKLLKIVFRKEIITKPLSFSFDSFIKKKERKKEIFLSLK